MAIKRQPVCFNLENESQKELFEKCKQKFGSNMSNGIRSVLWAYFNNTSANQQPISSFTIVKQEESEDLSTVL